MSKSTAELPIPAALLQGSPDQPEPKVMPGIPRKPPRQELTPT
jgi:hypothetical protein